MRENLGDFRKSIQILTFLSPLPHVPLPFTNTNNDLKNWARSAITEFGLLMKYWTSNPVWVTFQEHGSSFYVNIEEKVWLLVKKIRTWKDWQGNWNFAFWQKLGDFIETKAKKSPTSPGLVSIECSRLWIWAKEYICIYCFADKHTAVRSNRLLSSRSG